MQDVDEWIRSVTVGSEVCTCKAEHRCVTAILYEYLVPKFDLRPLFFFGLLDWVAKLLPDSWEEKIPHVGLPTTLALWLEDKYSSICERLGWCKLYDKAVQVTGGNHYELRPCCSDPQDCRAEKRGCKECI